MKFNVKITRERRFMKRFQKKTTIQRIQNEFDDMASEHEKLSERCKRISEMLKELENSK